jgi:hypothetical protein
MQYKGEARRGQSGVMAPRESDIYLPSKRRGGGSDE